MTIDNACKLANECLVQAKCDMPNNSNVTLVAAYAVAAAIIYAGDRIAEAIASLGFVRK